MLTQVKLPSYPNPTIQKLIQITDINVKQDAKNRIKQKLLEDAQLLLDRKKKEQEKKERIRKIQEQLEKQREQKLRVIMEKKNKSDLVIEKNRDVQIKKIKQQQDYFKQIITKNYRKEQEDIANAITKQRQFQSELSKSSVHRLKNNRANTTLDATFSNSRYDNSSQFQRLSEQIEKKAQNAQKNHENHTKQIVNRMREKAQTIQNAKQKALSYEKSQEIENLKNWSKKVDNIELVHQNMKLDRQKRLLERRRSFKNKIDKCSQNLKNLSYRQQQKYQQLQQKLIRKLSPKEWKDPRHEKYLKLWQQNSEKIKQQQDEDALKILLKHQQITEQNRAYKTRKEKLMQVIKFG